MSQRKKEGVRDAILAAAFRLFSDHGYNDTSIPAIAREAGMSTANVYVYFKSKLEILFTLYEPWLQERLDKLDKALARIPDRQERLERLLMALWRDLPREANGFANNIVQALSNTRNGDYDPHLRKLVQKRAAQWIAHSLALPPRDSEVVAGVLLMAFDGFAINVHLEHGMACTASTARLFAKMLSSLGQDHGEAAIVTHPNEKRTPT
jgi:AcrR family transcriptional regulator